MENNICLTIVMGKDGKPTPLSIPKALCHCEGKHFAARGDINEEDRQIKVNNEDYLNFLEKHKHMLPIP
tara:strand:- start:4077 stop:4283 length:207 start_codon:yes stop_codon:yes gene_type:complete